MALFGIDEIKAALKWAIGVLKSVNSKLEDDKLDWIEVVGVAYDARGIVELIRNRVELWNEVKDVDSEEFAVLIDYVKEEFPGVVSEEVEGLVVDGLDLLDMLVSYALKVKDVVKD